MSFTNINVEELAIVLEDENPQQQLIDVRELSEAQIAFIPQFKLLPLSESQQWMNQITTNFDPQIETIVLCHHGMRSTQMCQWLATQGFTQLKNVTGGIDAYSVAVDSSIPRY